MVQRLDEHAQRDVPARTGQRNAPAATRQRASRRAEPRALGTARKGPSSAQEEVSDPDSAVLSLAGTSVPAALQAMVDGIAQPARLTGLDGPGDYCNEAAAQLASLAQSDGNARGSSPSCSAASPGPSPPLGGSRIVLTFEGRRFELVVARDQADSGVNGSFAAIADAEVTAAPSSPWARRWRLSPRHARVAACVMQGLSDKQIAQQLSLSVSTVRTYVRDLYARVGVHRRVGLVRASMEVSAQAAEGAPQGVGDGTRRGR